MATNKYGFQIRNILNFFYENKDKIMTVEEIFQGILNFINSAYRSLDIIYGFEGLGILTRLSPNTFLFTGIKGMKNRIQNYIQRIKKGINDIQADEYFFTEQIQVNQKYINIKSQLYFAILIKETFGYFALSQQKWVNKEQLESIFSKILPKWKIQERVIQVNDIINMMLAMDILKKNETDTLIWDCSISDYLNPKRISFENLNNNINLKQKLIKVDQLQQNYLNNIIEEKTFDVYKSNNKEENEKNSFQQCLLPKRHFTYFPKMSYGLLQGRNWQYYIQSLQVIIGRSNILNDDGDDIRWHVDLELGSNRNISRQHAVILYNFQKERFEIKCLSKKYSIRVDYGQYSYLDDPIPLRNKSFITISGNNFFFFQAKPNSNQDNELKPELTNEELLNSQSIQNFDNSLSGQISSELKEDYEDSMMELEDEQIQISN